MSDALLPLLREVLAETRRQADATERLADAVAALVGVLRLRPGVRELLNALFPAAGPVVRETVFTSADVLAVPSLAAIADGQSSQSLSWIFTSAEGLAIAGYRIKRVGTDRGGALWRLHEAVTASAPATPAGCVPMEPDTDTTPRDDPT